MKLSKEKEKKIRKVLEKEFWTSRGYAKVPEKLEKLDNLTDDEFDCYFFFEDDVDNLIHFLKEADVVKNSKDAYKIYLKRVKKRGKAPLNEYITKLGELPGRKTFNKDLLEAIVGETQDLEDSCCQAVKGLAAKYLTGERPSDKKIRLYGGIEKATNGKVTEERIEKVSFSSLEKMIRDGNVLSSSFDRDYTYAETVLYELEETITDVIGYRYLCLVRTLEKSEGFSLPVAGSSNLHIPFLFREEKSALKFCEKVVAPGSEVRTELSPGKKIIKRKMREKHVYADKDEELKDYDKIQFKRILSFSLRGSAHEILILGTRSYKKEKYVIVYDVNYKQAKLPAVYELPFKAIMLDWVSFNEVTRAGSKGMGGFIFKKAK